MNRKALGLAVAVLIFGTGSVVRSDWEPGDGHKMHWPQTPKSGGWDVEFASSSLADDWMCSGSGPVTDIHFWISWMDDMWQPIEAIRVGIWSDWPAGAPGNPYPYSVPRTLLWERIFGPDEFARVDQPQDLQDWFDPSSGSWEPENHTLWEQINIESIPDPFVQQVDSIYWLEIDFGPVPFIGWKETDQNWNDDGVFWYSPDWIELRSPIGPSDFIRGDVDGDGDVDFQDAMFCGGGPPFLCADAADANDDGMWDPTDCDYIMDYVGGGGQPPPAPFPECGSDPTEDTLDCLDHPCPGMQQPSIDLAFVITGQEELDFGDAPDPTYPTLLASDGARHVMVPGMYLGSSVDAESDGQPSSNALRDDNDGNDDEDGVVITSLVVQNSTAEVKVTASTGGYLDGWIDFNSDGDWDEADEQVFTSMVLSPGTNYFVFTVPGSAVPGTTYGRFRYSSAGGLAPSGLADDGEVEDCRVFLLSSIRGIKMHHPQVPDLDNTGMDVDMSWAPWATLADDWTCTETGAVTDIHFWGSFADDILPAGGIGSQTFQLTIHDNIPGPPHSMPGDTLWTATFVPGQYEVYQITDNNPEDWYDPWTGAWLDDNHLEAYQYDFYPTDEVFVQDSGRIYWLSVREIVLEPQHRFGWKTTRVDLHWEDDATWFADPPFFWMPLTYPPGHEFALETVDLAFIITGEIGEGVFIRGDVYPVVEGASCGDGLIQMSDATAILRCLYVPGAPCPSGCWDCADCDDDGTVLMSDAVFLLKALYVPGAPLPPAPYPNCGNDMTADTLSGDCSCHWCN